MVSKTFIKAFAWTAIPIVGLSLISTAGALGNAVFILYFAWYIAAAIGIIALLYGVATGVAPARGDRKSVTAGVLSGVGIGVLALATTCFANLSTVSGAFS